MTCLKRKFSSSAAIAGLVLLSCSQMAFAYPAKIDNAISHLLNMGKFAEAEQLLEKNHPSEADRLFFKGRVQKAHGHLRESVDTFREVLRIEPSHINAKRELAHSLMLLKDYDVAEFHFKELMEVDKNTDMRDSYQNFIGSIQRNKPFGYSVGFAALPSTNVNRGSINQYFDTTLGRFVIDDDSKAESGVGAQISGSAFYRHQINKTDRVVLSGFVAGNLYANDEFDSLSNRLSINFEKRKSDWYFALGPYFQRNWKNDDSSNSVPGVQFAVGKRINEKWSALFSSLYEYRFYDIQDRNDGGYVSGTASVTRHFGQTLAVSVGLGVERSNPEKDYARYNGVKAVLQASKQWKGGLFTSAKLEGTERFYDNKFPLLGYERRDDVLKVSGTVGHNAISYKGFTPRLTCAYTYNQSNVSLYEYNAAECQVGLTRDF